MRTVPLLAALLPLVSATQGPTVTSIDLYGLGPIPREAVLAAVGCVEGEPMHASTREILQRVAALPGVAEVQCAPVQSPGELALFVGVRREGVAKLAFRTAPTGPGRLEPELLELVRKRLSLLTQAIRTGQAAEDHVEGYALSRYAPMREIEQEFIPIADELLAELAEVLHGSADAESRAAAAMVIAYASDKPRVAAELQYGAGDPDEQVRNNAVRALSILAAYGYAHPDLGLAIDPAPFLDLIGSLVWTDRNKGSAALESLSESRDPALFTALARQRLAELQEMACWKSVGHALFSVRILARMAGLSEAEIDGHMHELDDLAARRAWVDQLVTQVREGRSEH